MEETKSKPTLVVSLGAVIAALSGFAVLIIAARFLSFADNAKFLAFWATLFLFTGILAGIQQETTRAVASAPPGRTSAPIVALSIGVVAAVLLLSVAPLFTVFTRPLLTIGLIALGGLCYSGQVALVGTLGGLGKWNNFAIVTALEALARLALVAAVALTGSLLSFEIAVISGFAAWIILSFYTPYRQALGYRVDISYPVLVRKMLSAMAVAGATAFLVNGFPMIMALSTPVAEYQESADVVMAVSVTRAPLLVPLFAFQSVVIAHFVKNVETRRRSALRLFGAIAAIAAVLAPLAALVGPQIMAFIFGPEYANTPLTLALLVASATLLALLVLGGTINIALDSYLLCLIGWIAAAAIALLIMFFAPGVLIVRTLLALSLGPLVGILIHFWNILR